MNPTVVMTDMGKIGWSDPKKAGPMLDRIPMKQFAGEIRYQCLWHNHVQCTIVTESGHDVCIMEPLSVHTGSIICLQLLNLITAV